MVIAGGQEGSPVAVCESDLKKNLTEITLLLNDCLVKRMLRVVHDVLLFMRYPPLQNSSRGSRREPVFVISLFSFFKSMALMLLNE